MRRIGFFCFLCLSFLFLASCGKKEEVTEEAVEEKSEAVVIEVPPVSISGVSYGMVIKKTEDVLLLQTDEARLVRFPLLKETDLTAIGEELVTGAAVRVEYEGGLKKGKKKLKVQKVLPSDKSLKLSKEAAELCAEIILSFYNRDMESLSKLCEYPLMINRGEKRKIDDEKAFLAIKREGIFEKELAWHIEKVNPFMLTEYSDGYILGDSMPNLIVSNTKKGWKLSAFHFK